MRRRLPTLPWMLITIAIGVVGCAGGGSSIAPTAFQSATAGTATAAGTATPIGALAVAVATPAGSVSTSIPASGTYASLGPVGSGFLTVVTVPAATSGTGTVALSFAAALPASVPALASLKRASSSTGGSPAGIAYLSFTPTTNLALPTAPSFTLALAPGYSLPAGASLNVAFYDPTSPGGWTTLAGPATVTSGTAGYTFAANPAAMSFKAGTTYDFAFYSTAALLAPATSAPSPTPAPAPSATPFPGGATLVATFTAGVPAAAHSATFSFSGPAGTGVQTAALPANCSSPSCSVSVSAPSGVSTAVVLLYASTNSTGTPLAYASVSVSAPQVQSTSQNIPLVGIMATFAVALNPATVPIGVPTSIAVTTNAQDASGDALAPGFVNSAFATPTFTASVSDPTGAVTTSAGGAVFSGVGSGPATITLQTAGYAPASATLSYAAAPSLLIDYAAGVESLNGYFGVVENGSAGASLRNFSLPFAAVAANHALWDVLAFDPNGTLWIQSSTNSAYYGIKSDGTYAGTLTASGPILTFDVSGNMYALSGSPPSSTVNEYSVSGNALSMSRAIDAGSAVCAAAPGAGGVVYLGLCSGGVYEYASSGSGTMTPIASNANASAPLATDTQGNVYAATSGGFGKWNAGTFGSGSPAVTYVYQSSAVPGQTALTPLDIAVDTAGNIFAEYLTLQSNRGTVVFPNGSTIAAPTNIAGSPYYTTYIATPLR